MKKIFLIVFALLFVVLGAELSIAETSTKGDTKMDKDNKKVLVVYYSLSGNTRAVAKEIQKYTGGDTFELKTVESYPTSYRAQTEQAKKEIQEGYKPALKEKINNIDQYDVIFVGSPCWWSTYAPAVSTFLADYNLEGKTIIPFMTHGGSGLGNTMSNIKKDAPKSTIINGLAIRGSNADNSEAEVKKFIDNLNLK